MVLACITLLLVVCTRSWFKSILVLMAVPFSDVGELWLCRALGYHLSVATWIGMIALLGLDAETGVFMLLFLDLAYYYDETRQRGRMHDGADLDEAIIDGAVRRVRPKLMSVVATLAGLMPILISSTAGADVMKRIAAPMVGGLVTSFLLELLVYPAAYKLWHAGGVGKEGRREPLGETPYDAHTMGPPLPAGTVL